MRFSYSRKKIRLNLQRQIKRDLGVFLTKKEPSDFGQRRLLTSGWKPIGQIRFQQFMPIASNSILVELS